MRVTSCNNLVTLSPYNCKGFAYDVNGNLTASGDGWTVTYNLLNLPASAVKNAGSVLERYDYYPYGEKIDVSVASSGNTGKGNLGTQNGYFCPNSAILKLMGQKTTYLVRKRSYDGQVRTNRPAVHRKLPCIRIRILKIICIFRNNRYICP